MERKKSRFFAALGGIYAGVNLFLLLIFYIPVYVLGAEFTTWYESWLYLCEGITSLLEFIMPLPFAAALWTLGREDSFGKNLSRSLAFALPKLVYTLPYYYLYALSYGYDSIEGTLISLGVSAGAVLISLGHVILLLLVMDFASRRGISGILVGALVELAYHLIIEIIDTVSYLVGYAGDYRIEEIIYIVVCYLLLLLGFILSYLLAHAAERVARGAWGSGDFE